MALRTGTRYGPATTLDYVGIIAGFLAALSIVVYVVAGGLWINDNDRYGEQQDAATEILELLDEDAGIRGEGTVDRTVFENTVDLDELNGHIVTLDCASRFQPVAAVMWDIVNPATPPPAVAVSPAGKPCDDRSDAISENSTTLESDVDVQRLRVLANRVKDDATFSHLHDMMSDLGDRHDAVGIWFLVVNVAVGGLLVLFAYAVFRRMPVGRWVVLLLIVTAILSATLGLSRCQLSCDLTEVRISDRFAHTIAALALLILIVVIPALAWLDLRGARRPVPGGDPRYLRKLARVCHWLPQLATISAVATLIAVFVGSYAGLFQRLTWAIGYAFVVAVALAMWGNRRGLQREVFDVTRVQENVLYGSPARGHGRYLLGSLESEFVVRFKRQLMSAVEEELIRPEMRRPRPALAEIREFTVTVGFTKQGLEKLEVPYHWTSTDFDAFGDGMRNRTELLGTGAGKQFDPRWATEPDLVFWITGESTDAVRTAQGLVRRRFGRCVSLTSLPTMSMEDRVLGFADGLSNPWIMDVHPEIDPVRQGGGKLNSKGEWERLALGEFVIGQIDETRDVYPVPEPEPVFDAGTFLVLQQLEVDIDQFDLLVTEGLESDPNQKISEDDVAAKMMGRTREGIALATSLDGAAGWKNNSFSYGDDPEGFKCPLGSHARRANPRDSLGFEGVPAHRRRIIRRGMPYRIERKDGQPKKEGLMFAAFNVRVADQFEFIQRQWLDDGDAFRLGNAPDPIAGRLRSGRPVSFIWHTVDGPRRIKLDREKPVTRCVGGAYFLVPSIAGLQAIARDS